MRTQKLTEFINKADVDGLIDDLMEQNTPHVTDDEIAKAAIERRNAARTDGRKWSIQVGEFDIYAVLQ